MTQKRQLIWCLLTALLPLIASALPSERRVEKLSPAFHKDRLEEIYRRCPDGLILLLGEGDWYRKRELRAFDSSYADFNFKQERNLFYLTGVEVPNSFVLIDPKKKEVRLYTNWKGARELDETTGGLGVLAESDRCTGGGSAARRPSGRFNPRFCPDPALRPHRHGHARAPRDLARHFR